MVAQGTRCAGCGIKVCRQVLQCSTVAHPHPELIFEVAIPEGGLCQVVRHIVQEGFVNMGLLSKDLLDPLGIQLEGDLQRDVQPKRCSKASLMCCRLLPNALQNANSAGLLATNMTAFTGGHRLQGSAQGRRALLS